jgi:hypothetical protein
MSAPRRWLAAIDEGGLHSRERKSETFGPWVKAMCNPTRSIFAASLAAGCIGLAAFFASPVVAQPMDKVPAPQAQPDPEFIVKPPAQGNPRLMKPAPPDRDPGLVKKPPADAKGDSKGANDAKPDEGEATSRRDDCRGTAEDCRQISPR